MTDWILIVPALASGLLCEVLLQAGVRPGMKLVDREVFGPVVSILPFARLNEAIDRVNASPYGLATGIFTRNLDHAFGAALKLEVGSVHINETCSSR